MAEETQEFRAKMQEELTELKVKLEDLMAAHYELFANHAAAITEPAVV